MEKPDNQSHLPKVEQDDILSLVVEDILDANHMERWDHLLQTNPTLANEIRKRAHIEATQSTHFDVNSVQFQKRIIDTATFAIQALEVATLRQLNKTSDQEVLPTIVDVDGEDQPLSA